MIRQGPMLSALILLVGHPISALSMFSEGGAGNRNVTPMDFYSRRIALR